MIPLPPNPDEWRDDGRLTAPGDDRRIILNGAVIYTRNWRRLDDGTMAFDYQHATDAEFERLIAALSGRVAG